MTDTDDELELVRDALRSLTGTSVRDQADAERRQQLWFRLGELIDQQERLQQEENWK
jgi:hypothetical protein